MKYEDLKEKQRHKKLQIKLNMQLKKIQLLIAWNAVKGILFVKMKLLLIQIKKELFVIDIEQG